MLLLNLLTNKEPLQLDRESRRAPEKKSDAVAQTRSDFLLLMEEREKGVKSHCSQVRSLKAELKTEWSSQAHDSKGHASGRHM
ncbi:hypothetical protein ON010_g7290 [Phytophthora cinnamomi]|nr:hypothetical protein ON010_g7290 [Phytophthora cinnamomi]